jgi:microcystin-dependent protein
LGSYYVGEIVLVGFNFAPVGFNACNGALVSISQNDTLYSLIGTTFGGDGVSTFQLPDLQGRVSIHQGTGVGLSGYVMGQRGGVETVTVLSPQMPLHTHALSASSADATVSDPSNAYFAGAGQSKFYSDQAPANAMNVGMVNSMGGNQPHTNLQPFATCNWIISLFGVYPPQS